MSLISKYFLSSFPLFLYFFAILRGFPPFGQFRTPPHSAMPVHRRKVSAVKKLGLRVHFTHLSTQFEFV